MQPNRFTNNLREYPLASHKAWEHKDKAAVLKLDWNESDLRLPLRIRKAVTAFVMDGPTHWYPDIANRHLIAAIAHYVKVPEAYVQYFAGEDSALDYAVRAFVAEGDDVVLMAPTYDNFRVYVESIGATPRFVYGKNLFVPDIAALMKGITPRTKMVYLVNPNNPTGALYSAKDIERALTAFPKVVFIVDEAYGEFAGKTVVPLTQKYKNLIVGKSFSKAFGLASYRMGYLITAPENLVHINKIRNGKSISALSQVAALAALKDPSYSKRYVAETRRAMRYLRTELAKLGFSVTETAGNFVLIELADPRAFAATLRDRGVFIRTLDHLPSMERHVRVTVGTMATARTFVTILKDLMKKGAIAAH
ncbi:MAG TPA: histidinol-phosphate transaminase [Candidatus Paceibacterota bacterium]|nr:histidinol-phosphate transaminase [Candidatus Paceibacterota bacterium]